MSLPLKTLPQTNCDMHAAGYQTSLTLASPSHVGELKHLTEISNN